jgi:hypothetical protein
MLQTNAPRLLWKEILVDSPSAYINGKELSPSTNYSTSDPFICIEFDLIIRIP